MSQVKTKFITNNAVTNAKLAQIAAHSYKGNNTGSTANVADITSTQLTADLNLFSNSLQGLTPASGGGTTNFLRADGTWSAPSGGSGTVTSVDMSVPAFLSVSGNPITTSGTLTVTLSGTALPIANGGTAVTSVTAAPTATAFAGWDANKNLSATNFISGQNTTTTSAGTLTLTVGSNYQQYFTGTSTETVVLPVVSTLTYGQQYLIQNRSTGNITVQSSGGGTVKVMGSNSQLLVTVIAITGTTPSSWDYAYSIVQGSTQILTVQSESSTYTFAASDGIVLANSSGGSFTVTLPTAAGITGQVYTVKKTSSDTNTVTLATTSSQTIDGSTSRGIITQNEVVTVMSDGSNWQVLEHKTNSPWTSYTPTFTGFGTVSSVAVYSRRVGDSLQVRGSIVVGSSTTAVTPQITLGFGGTNSNVTIDTSKIESGAGTIVGTAISAWSASTTFGWQVLAQGGNGYLTIGFQSSTTNATSATNASTQLQTSAAFQFFAEVPISNWWDS